MAAPEGAEAVANPDLRRSVGLLHESPYDRGWVCVLHPSNLSDELPQLRIGRAVVAWYQDEIARLKRERPAGGGQEIGWADLQAKFFPTGRVTATAPLEPVGA